MVGAIDLPSAPEGAFELVAPGFEIRNGCLLGGQLAQNGSMEPQCDRRRGGTQIQALLQLPANRHKGELIGREQRVHLALRVRRRRTRQGLAELNPLVHGHPGVGEGSHGGAPTRAHSQRVPRWGC